METTHRTDVVIIGAGPTGLSLACQFVRYGVDFIILEKGEGVTPHSKAIGVHARTLEIFEQIGLARKAVDQGTIAGKGRLVVGGEVRGEIDFTDIGKGFSVFPFVLMLEQSRSEQLMYEYLQQNGKEVLWKTELESFTQDADGVVAHVRDAEGEARQIEARYIVGCDGPKSPVRQMLGLTFEGSTFERLFYVADVRIDWKLGHDALTICFSKGSFVVFFPLKGEKRYRIVGVLPDGETMEDGDTLYQQIEAKIREESKLDLDIHDVHWFSTYKVHTRHVDRFSSGRGFLAGDAAHIHTPAGAQGMNTGIQDAYNLAWKMALVLRGGTNEKLLETYNEERLENARHLLKTTDRLFELAAGKEWLLAFLRTSVLPTVAGFVLGIERVRKFIFPTLSQIGIDYRNSSLSRHTGDNDFDVRAGERMPWFLIDGESIYDRLCQPKFHLLIFTDATIERAAVETAVKNSYADLIDLHILPLAPRVTEIFDTERAFSLLLRPDNHIAFITPETEGVVDTVRDYLERFVDTPYQVMSDIRVPRRVSSP